MPLVEVRNLANGRTVEAEVTDRGPYVRGSIFIPARRSVSLENRARGKAPWVV